MPAASSLEEELFSASISRRASTQADLTVEFGA